MLSNHVVNSGTNFLNTLYDLLNLNRPDGSMEETVGDAEIPDPNNPAKPAVQFPGKVV